METLKACVIGVGNMGKHHARVYSELDNVELVGVSDLDEGLGKAVANRHGANYYTDYREMLAKERPDCASVVVPTALHSKIGCDALGHCSVLVEKPIARSEEEAVQLIDAGKKAGNLLMVGHIERFNPVITYLKEYAKKENYLSFNIMRLGPYIPKTRSTGVLMDMGIHDIDLVRYLTGEEPIHIHASCRHVLIKDHEDHAHVFMKMPSASASLVSNWISPRKIRHMYVVLDKSFLYLNYITQAIKVYEREEDLDPLLEEGPAKEITMKRQEPLKLELGAFLGAVEKGGESPVSGEDALESLKIALKAEEIAYGNSR